MSALVLMLAVSFSASPSSPDPPEAILASVEQRLLANKSSDARAYVETMLRNYPGYVPAAIADAALYQLESGNPEKLLRLLKSLDSTLNKHWQYYSPMFEEMAKTGIQRCRSDLGDAPRINERNMVSSGADLVFRFESKFRTLLLLSPMVAISKDPDNEPVPYTRHIITTGNAEPSQIQLDTFIKSLSHGCVPTPAEMEKVECLSKLPVDKGVPALIKLLEAFTPLIALTAAETLSDYGEAARPAILASLREPPRGYRKLLEIYALVRIGVYDSEIKEVLSSLSPEDPRAQAYAPKALKFLSAKAGQGAAPVK